MSFLSRLFNRGSASPQAELERMNGKGPGGHPSRDPAENNPVAKIYRFDPRTQPAGPRTLPGNSWGPTVPDEPCQYNYPGGWREYFEKIFSGEFSDYRVTRAGNPRSQLTTVYRFYAGDRQVLTVELMSRRCGAQALRQQCQARGIPYLRFYYDYRGWWNTQSYVTERIRGALAQ